MKVYEYSQKTSINDAAEKYGIKVSTAIRYIFDAKRSIQAPTKRSVFAAKVLVFDIETAPLLAHIWNRFPKFVSNNQILADWFMLSWSAKWLNEGASFGDVLTDKEAIKQDDTRICSSLWELMNKADVVIAHNGDKFDLAWIRTRCLFHKIPMFPKYTTIDTLKVARQKFRFNSNRLNYIADYLGIGQKIKTEYSLWKDILLKKDKIAMEKMIKYCKKDVSLLEQVFVALKGHIEAKTHYGVIFGEDRGSCPECGSDDLIKSKKVVTATGLIRIQYRCKTCGKYCSKTDK